MGNLFSLETVASIISMAAASGAGAPSKNDWHETKVPKKLLERRMDKQRDK